MTQNLGAAPAIVGVPSGSHATHPVQLVVDPAFTNRNRLTCAFRPILAIPHILLVGGPIAFATFGWHAESEPRLQWGAGGGVLGGAAVVIAIIAWFAIVFDSQYPEGLRSLVVYYLRWRVRAVAYLLLLRDEYPPFGEGAYAAILSLPSNVRHDRVSVAFRLFLAIPQIIVLWFLGVALCVTTLIAWVGILITGSYPAKLYPFAVGVLRWSTRVEAYLFLLHDDYPPFSLE